MHFWAQPTSVPGAVPVIRVTKMDGSAWFGVDCRKVNEVSQFDAYPVPQVDELLDQLGTAHFFYTIRNSASDLVQWTERCQS